MGIITSRSRQEAAPPTGLATGTFTELLRLALLERRSGFLASRFSPEIGMAFERGALIQCWTSERSLGLPAALGRYGLVSRHGVERALDLAGGTSAGLPAVLRREGLLEGPQVAAAVALFAGDLILESLRAPRAPWVWTSAAPTVVDAVPVSCDGEQTLDLVLEACRRLWDPETAAACLGGAERFLAIEPSAPEPARRRFGADDRAALERLAEGSVGDWLAGGDAWDRSGTLLAAWCVGFVGERPVFEGSRDPERMLRAARRREDRGDHQGALEALRALLRAHPGHPQATAALRALPAAEPASALTLCAR